MSSIGLTEEDDPLVEQTAVNIELAFPARRSLDDHGYKRHEDNPSGAVCRGRDGVDQRGCRVYASRGGCAAWWRAWERSESRADMGDTRARRSETGWRTVLLAALIAALAVTVAVARARAEPVTPILQTVRATSVYANPTVPPTLTPAQVARVRAEIDRRDPGRLWIAVVSPEQANAAVGVSGLANALATGLARPGTVLVVAGSQLWVVTSYAATGGGAGRCPQGVYRASRARGRTGGVGRRDRRVSIPAVDPGRRTRPQRRPRGRPPLRLRLRVSRRWSRRRRAHQRWARSCPWSW